MSNVTGMNTESSVSVETIALRDAFGEKLKKKKKRKSFCEQKREAVTEKKNYESPQRGTGLCRPVAGTQCTRRQRCRKFQHSKKKKKPHTVIHWSVAAGMTSEGHWSPAAVFSFLFFFFPSIH